jgi:hypothetical protein
MNSASSGRWTSRAIIANRSIGLDNNLRFESPGVSEHPQSTEFHHEDTKTTEQAIDGAPQFE